MRFFYDTEFLEDGITIELISIGIVAEDGEEYYAVNADLDRDRIVKDPWMLNNVWRHLPVSGLRTGLVTVGDHFESRVKQAGFLDRTATVVRPKWVIANEVRDFLLDHGTGRREDTELWADYGAYDHVALAQLWGRMISLPNHVPMWTHDLQQLIAAHPDAPRPDRAAAEAHHALADARHVRATWQALARAGGTPL